MTFLVSAAIAVFILGGALAAHLPLSGALVLAVGVILLGLLAQSNVLGRFEWALELLSCFTVGLVLVSAAVLFAVVVV